MQINIFVCVSLSAYSTQCRYSILITRSEKITFVFILFPRHFASVAIFAYGCYQNNELELCLYSLFELEKVPVDKHLKIRYHLLYGSLLSRRERHFEALKEFFKPLSIALEDKQEGSNFYAVALYLIAEEYEKLFNKAHAIQKENVQHNERYKKIISEAPGKLYVLLRADHLETLQKLVTVLKEGDDCITNISITGRILNMLHPQPEVNLPIAIYKLASRLAMDESYSNAAELFVELLAQTDLQPVPSLIMQLPSLSVIYHSAATMLLKSNDLQQAEQLCNRVISFHSSKSARPVDMEHSLLCLQEDLVALMLLARIHRLRAEVILESEILDKCVRVIYHYTNQNNSSNEDMKNVNTSEPNIMQLLNILASKLHLQKAHNYLLRGSDFDNDAFFQFKQAIFHNPRDRDVVSAYISFLKDNHLDEPNVLRTLDNCSHFHGEETNSSALKYLMQPEDKDDSDMDMFAE
ncbi:uncharacterized protein [Periplaneta americana]|uniref:uncharacterized protein isoform X2 n=1 Tax=Periplaneta americana TaxID=6978 RepID=UPI0037E75185